MTSEGFLGDEYYVERTINLAMANIKEGGRPFACLIVNNTTGEILAESANKVAQSGNPTSHAEIMAMHEASRKLRERGAVVDGTNGGVGEDYKGHTFYILPKPCPMCMAAMAYAGPDEIVFSTVREEYAKYYRDDRRHFTMEDFNKALVILNATVPMRYVANPKAVEVYKEWQRLNRPEDVAKTEALAAKKTKPEVKQVPFKSTQAGVCPFDGKPFAHRPEKVEDGETIPVWREADELACLSKTSEEDHLDIVSFRGDDTKNFYATMRQLNNLTRSHYAQFIHDCGMHIRPMLIASDYEPGFSGVGSTFTVLKPDGSSEKICPCPAEYEVFKSASHLMLGLSSVITPYFKCPTGRGWQKAVGDFKALAGDARMNAEKSGLDATMVTHLVKFFEIVEGYCKKCLDTNSVALEGFKEFTKVAVPLIHVNMANAGRIQIQADMDALIALKQRMGPMWRDMYFVIPTVWPVSGDNPRQRMLAFLMDQDRVQSHIIKMEGKSTMEDILDTAGRIIGDRAVASLVFPNTCLGRDSKFALSTPRDLVSSSSVDAMLLYLANNPKKLDHLGSGVAPAALKAIKEFAKDFSTGSKEYQSNVTIQELYIRPMSCQEFGEGLLAASSKANGEPPAKKAKK